MMEFTKLLMTRSELTKLSGSVEPKGTNQLQAQYIEISENIGLHRKARSTLNKDRVCMCVCVCACACMYLCVYMCVLRKERREEREGFRVQDTVPDKRLLML